MRRFLAALLLALAGLLLASDCGKEAPPPARAAFYEVTDSADRLVRLEKKPEHIVLLGTAFPEMLMAVGGDFDAWADSPGSEPPAWAAGKKTVGYTYQVNAEAVISMKPDLVVGLNGLHNHLAAVLEANRIPFLLLSLSRYEDVERAVEILADATDHHEEGTAAIAKLRQGMEETEAKMPSEGLSCAILHGTARTVTLEGPGTIASETAERLHIRNVFTEDLANGVKMPPFSLEALAEKDPDIIFLTTMVMPGQQEAAFRKALLEQPAWSGLKAVETGRVYFLPQALFLSSPGIHYPDALKTMARMVYPEDFQ